MPPMHARVVATVHFSSHEDNKLVAAPLEPIKQRSFQFRLHLKDEVVSTASVLQIQDAIQVSFEKEEITG